MKTLFAALITSLALSGCAVFPTGYDGGPVVVFEPEVYVGDYYVGYYRPDYGYWTGYGWDIRFYEYGHRGCGHYYRGAPPEAWYYYHDGNYYRGDHNFHSHIPSYPRPVYNDRPHYDHDHYDHERHDHDHDRYHQ